MVRRFVPLLLLSALVVMMTSCKTVTKSTTPKASVGPILVEPSLGHARTYFQRNDYERALLALKATNTVETLFIAAESNYRLGNYDMAAKEFKRLAAMSNDLATRQIAEVRLFDIDLAQKKYNAAFDRYVAISKAHSLPLSKMAYSLGKTFYDQGQRARAQDLLRAVPVGSEFAMRAHYLLAVMALNNKQASVDERVAPFAAISAAAPVTVEDYTVRELALLAEARINVAAQREEVALALYARVNLVGELGETATIEAIRTMLAYAREARRGEGRFSTASSLSRKATERDATMKALEVMGRYRKYYEVDWHKPELLTLMARLYVETKRYDDARIALSEIIDHYRLIQQTLQKAVSEKSVWPYFALELDKNVRTSRTLLMVPGVPNSLLRDVVELDEITALRDRIEADDSNLRALGERSLAMGITTPALSKARTRQTAITRSYDAMVIDKQKRIRKFLAGKLNNLLAEAEFLRAELVTVELADVQMQEGAAQDFQNQQVRDFENKMKQLDEGGAQ